MINTNRRYINIISAFLSIILAFSFCSIAFADFEHAIADDHAITEEELSPMALYTICPTCGSNAGLYCMGSKLVSSENVTSHVYSGGTCRVLIYKSYSKYCCLSCGWSQLRFADGSSSLSKHYCDSYHYDCGQGLVNTCDLNYIPIS